MPIEYRACEELELLSRMRMAYIRHEHAEMGNAEFEEIKKATFEFLGKALAEGRYAGFVGEIGGEAVCSAGLLAYDLPPIDSTKIRRVGHVLNFFTLESQRRKGYGKGLMDFMIRSARERGFDRIVLNATPDGYPLYLACGFAEPAFKAMSLSLRA